MTSLLQPANYGPRYKTTKSHSASQFRRNSMANSDGNSASSVPNEGTPDEVATAFKYQGDGYFSRKRYREALHSYTQGIEASPTADMLMRSLLLNRAACNLNFKKFEHVIRDCSRILSSLPTSVEAMYGSALALIALERADEAIDCCHRALAIDSEKPAFKIALEKALFLKKNDEVHERGKLERSDSRERESLRLEKALKARNITVVPAQPGGPAWNLLPGLSAGDPATLSLPVIFTYPKYYYSDVISSYDEEMTFAEHLAMMFPPEAPRPTWDVAHDYTFPHLAIYVRTRRNRLLKIGANATLVDVYRNSAANEGEEDDGLEMVDGHLSFVVLPKGAIEREWVQESQLQQR